MTRTPMPEMVGRQDLALMLGIDPQSVSRLVRKGVLVQVEDGQFDACRNVRAYLENVREGARAKVGSPAAQSLRAAKIEQIERRLRREDRFLITMEEALEVHDYVAGVLLAGLDSFAAKLGPKVADEARREKVRLQDDFARSRRRLATGKEVDA